MVWWNAVSNTATCGTLGVVLAGDLDAPRPGRVVQGRERGQRLQLGEHGVVHEGGAREAVTAVHDPVPDGQQRIGRVPQLGEQQPETFGVIGDGALDDPLIAVGGAVDQPGAVLADALDEAGGEHPVAAVQPVLDGRRPGVQHEDAGVGFGRWSPCCSSDVDDDPPQHTPRGSSRTAPVLRTAATGPGWCRAGPAPASSVGRRRRPRPPSGWSAPRPPRRRCGCPVVR